MTITPEIGKRVTAKTMTETEQTVTILVSSVQEETQYGWRVSGYRVGQSAGRNAGRRQTAFPRSYFVSKN
jgi:hypothetical protein